MDKIKIIVADDHPLLLRGLKYSINSENNMEVIGEAKDGNSALDLIIRLHPDMAILDYDMPKKNGIEVLTELRKIDNSVKVIFLTMHQEQLVFNNAVKLNVDGYLLKDSIDEEIVDAINTIYNGKKYFDPVLSAKLITDSIDEKRSNNKLENLTKSELKVIELVAENKTTQEIAQTLFISDRTVDNHRSNICKKLDISGHNALMRFVIKNKDLF